MTKKHNASTEEEMIEKGSNKEAEKIDSLDLAMELYPLLDDYFCGTFERNTKGVLMKMENGQVFQLTVEEVA